jgi:hypothetical protein
MPPELTYQSNPAMPDGEDKLPPPRQTHHRIPLRVWLTATLVGVLTFAFIVAGNLLVEWKMYQPDRNPSIQWLGNP